MVVHGGELSMVRDEELLTVREAAVRLQISEATIRDWIRRKKISTFKPEIGRGFYVDLAELMEKTKPRKQER